MARINGFKTIKQVLESKRLCLTLIYYRGGIPYVWDIWFPIYWKPEQIVQYLNSNLDTLPLKNRRAKALYDLEKELYVVASEDDRLEGRTTSNV